jgi:hypothetical protein
MVERYQIINCHPFEPAENVLGIMPDLAPKPLLKRVLTFHTGL